ncbi:hypothetical protein AURDEDRAFT_170292 [Auricularia subglabra TFB-10046 SS5]|nr:hypothetical protein AURDEDRAFT_170292 [Auricularia subglabra TFB-10046 SS5]
MPAGHIHHCLLRPLKSIMRRSRASSLSIALYLQTSHPTTMPTPPALRPQNVRRDQLRALVRAINMALAEDSQRAYDLIEKSLLDIFCLREIMDNLDAQRMLLESRIADLERSFQDLDG